MKIGLVREQSNTPGMGSLFINYDGAANIETPGFRGLSHLWEHCACHSYDSLQERLMAAGIVANAMTSDRNVVFYWMGLDEKIEEFQKELLDLIYYIPTKEEFENEKKIVMQEYEDYVSKQNFVFSNIMRKYFDYFGPIGYRDDIVNITYTDFLCFVNKNFSIPTSIVRIGNSETIVELTKDIQFQTAADPIPLNELATGILTHVENPSKFPTSTLIADWATFFTDELSVQDVKLINALFSKGLSSPFYQEIREKRGLVYHCGTDIELVDAETYVWFFYAGCTEMSMVEVRSVMKDIVSNYKDYITTERFESVVELYRNNAKMSKIGNHGHSYINKFFVNETEILDEEYLNGLDYNEFQKSLEFFKNSMEFLHEAHNGPELSI
jgi:predicted Zn-dependent peptidase